MFTIVAYNLQVHVYNCSLHITSSPLNELHITWDEVLVDRSRNLMKPQIRLDRNFQVMPKLFRTKNTEIERVRDWFNNNDYNCWLTTIPVVDTPLLLIYHRTWNTLEEGLMNNRIGTIINQLVNWRTQSWNKNMRIVISELSFRFTTLLDTSLGGGGTFPVRGGLKKSIPALGFESGIVLINGPLMTTGLFSYHWTKFLVLK